MPPPPLPFLPLSFLSLLPTFHHQNKEGWPKKNNQCYDFWAKTRVFVQFNVLWLDPANPDAFPIGLVEAMNEMHAGEWGEGGEGGRSMEERLRAQMQADALRPLGDDEDQPKNADTDSVPLPPGSIHEATQFLLLNVSVRHAVSFPHLLFFLSGVFDPTPMNI
jgi:hypothetical protein